MEANQREIENWKERANLLLSLGDTQDDFTIDDCGVWPAAERQPLDEPYQEHDSLDWWKPHLVFAKDDDCPDLVQIPALPFPFSAGELAAFMMNGNGTWVSGRFGDWAHGPKDEGLQQIPAVHNKLRNLVKGAYEAYRTAAGKVGSRHLELKAKSDSARIMYNEAMSAALERGQVSDAPYVSNGVNSEYARRLARAKDSVKDLGDEMERTQAEWDTANQDWLKAMVRELLGVGVEIESSAPVTDTQPQAAQTSEPGNWKMKVQAEAAARFKRLRAAGSSPTVHSILDDMVTWCRANDVKSGGGVFPSAGYLRTHVLGGKHWTPPR